MSTIYHLDLSVDVNPTSKDGGVKWSVYTPDWSYSSGIAPDRKTAEADARAAIIEAYDEWAKKGYVGD